MSLTLREQGIETVHDEVVSQVAQRWAKAFVCKVTIKSGLEQPALRHRGVVRELRWQHDGMDGGSRN